VAAPPPPSPIAYSPVDTQDVLPEEAVAPSPAAERYDQELSTEPVSFSPGPFSREPSSDADPAEASAPARPRPGSSFIELKHHPRSGKRDEFISLEDAPLEADVSVPDCAPFYDEDTIGRPWAPFRTLADLEAARICVEGRLPDDLVLALLNGAPTWGDGTSKLSLRTIADLDRVMEMARRHVPIVSH
jgi:hypothetical protein